MKLSLAAVAAVVSMWAGVSAQETSPGGKPEKKSGSPPASSPKKTLIGISMNPREGGTEEDIGKAIISGKGMGLGLIYLSYKWSELEPQEGSYAWKPLDDALPILTALGFEVAITIQTIDTNNRTLPRDLQEKPFDDQALRGRFDRLLEALAPKLTPAVRWVMLGNEVDGYLGEHPKELEAFAGLVERGRERLRARKPAVLVGVTTMHDGGVKQPAAVARLNRSMDVVSITYYPLDVTFSPRPIAWIDREFDGMVRRAGGKPLFLQEVGLPADPLLGSSEEMQAAFIDAVFDAAAKHPGEIAGLNFFLLHDFPSSVVDDLLRYYRFSSPRFRAFLATLGLKRADGTPRKAWARFEERVREWGK